MIKFKYIIHKETGTVIKYEDWLKELKISGFIGIKSENKKHFIKTYPPITTIFSDDFEIIYNSEFTLQELAYLFDNINQKELADKILNLCIEKKSVKDKYGIDI